MSRDNEPMPITYGEYDALFDKCIALQARVAELEHGKHWLADLPFFREQIANATVQTPYGEGLPAPWTFLSMACDCVDALANRVAELEAQEPVAWSVRDKHRRFITESAARAAEYESLGQTIVPLCCCKAPPSTAAQPADEVVRDAALKLIEAIDKTPLQGSICESDIHWYKRLLREALLAASAQSSKQQEGA